MPLTVTSAPRQLSDGNTAGTVLGQSATDLISFFNQTPSPQILQGTLKGALGILNIYTTAQSPASVIANTSGERAMTVTGVLSTDMVAAVIKPTTQAGLLVGTGRVSGTNTVQVTFGNDTGTAITPTTTESYLVVTAPAAFQLSATLTPLSVASQTTAEQQFTVAGVLPGMSLAVSKPSVNAGLVVSQSARIIAANTVGITFTNCTAGVLTPTASEVYLFFASVGLRPMPAMVQIPVSLSPVSVASQTTAEQTFTVAGLASGQPVLVDKPSLTPGLAVANARVSALNTLAINFANASTAAITPPTETYLISYFPNAIAASGSVTAVPSAVGADPGAVLNTFGLTG